MKPKNNKVKMIFFDAGGVLFDTSIKGEDRIRYLMMERGYSKSKKIIFTLLFLGFILYLVY